jgi:hypothetical protein
MIVQQSNEDGNNGNDDQQLDQHKGPAGRPAACDDTEQHRHALRQPRNEERKTVLALATGAGNLRRTPREGYERFC